MLNKCQDPYLALLAYRSTPLPICYSPSELLMSRTLRSTVPVTREQRAPSVSNPNTVRAKDAELKTMQKDDGEWTLCPMNNNQLN